MVNEGNAYTASELVHASDMSNYNLPASRGWVAGIKLTWQNNQQNATQTTEEFGDSAGWRSQSSFTVYNNGDNTPSGSGLKNATTSTGTWIKTYYNSTAEWYVYVTPEMMYQWSKNGVETYTATLTVKETNRSGWSNVTTPTTYTITIPTNLTLKDGDGVAWYPAAGLLGEKVYGDAQLLASAVELDNYQDVKFLVDPSGLAFPDGFAAGNEVDGVWGVKMLHNHSWSFNVVDGTNLVATCGAANCPYNNGEVRMWLNVGTTEKEYDGQSVTRKAVFDEYFEDVFNEVSTSLTVNNVADGTINTAGVYTVALSVTGVGGDSEPYVLSTTVTINKKDISGATLVLTPASPTYNAEEQTVTPSVTVDGLAATIEIADGSTTAATEIGEYSVTVNGTGNFTGTASATWEIVNTTGSLSGVAAASAGSGDVENNILTVADTTALVYEEGVWTAGLVLTWPMDKQDSLTSGHAYYVNEESAKVLVSDGIVSNSEATAKFRKNALSGEKQFTYLANTTWTVAITPAVVEAAIAEDETALEYTMRAGALVWGDSTEGDPDGVAFANYKIELSLENPITFVLGENETHDLGETVLTTTRIKLAPGASVTSSVAQTTEGAIFIETPGYDIVWSENDGVYTYTTKFTHEHAWTFDVVDGTNLVATCGNDDCDMGGEVRMWLDVETTEKEYDGQSVKRIAAFDEHFMDVFPEAVTVLTVNGVENGVINDAGVYTVALSVTGLGDGETHVLSTTVTINKKDISGATLVLTPASPTYNAAEQTVTPSVTVGGLAATLEVAEGSTTAATEIGTYSVTVNGTGNFTGTTSAKWEIVNTTGEPASVAASAAGSMANVGNDFTLSDSSKLEYDSENKVWHAGITITWPMSKTDYAWYVVYTQQGSANYVKEDSARITTEDGVIANVLVASSYKTGSNSSKGFTCLSTTTWKVPLTPAIIEAAIAEEKSALTYTMNAGALVWGDATEGDPDGVAFRDYTITIPLEGIKLYDENGHQVHPVQSDVDIVEEMKGAIDAVEGLDEGGKTAAKAKVDALVEAADGDENEVRDWIKEKTDGDYGVLAQSDYIVASYMLATGELITDASDVAFKSFETAGGGVALSVTVDGEDIEAARAKAAGIIRAGTDLWAFDKIELSRISAGEGGRLEISPKIGCDREFFKLEIDRD